MYVCNSHASGSVANVAPLTPKGETRRQLCEAAELQANLRHHGVHPLFDRGERWHRALPMLHDRHPLQCCAASIRDPRRVSPSPTATPLQTMVYLPVLKTCTKRTHRDETNTTTTVITPCKLHCSPAAPVWSLRSWSIFVSSN